MLETTSARDQSDTGGDGQSHDVRGDSANPIVGRVLLANGTEVACTAVMHTPLRGEIHVLAEVMPGEIVICALAYVGILVGKVTDVLPVGIDVTFMIKNKHQMKVAARLKWHGVRANRLAQLRGAPQIVPVHRSVEVGLAGTIIVTGTIIDISPSGAAITLHPDPGRFVGSQVRIGARPARVVRAIEGGVAVQFVEPFLPDSFDERVRP